MNHDRRARDNGNGPSHAGLPGADEEDPGGTGGGAGGGTIAGAGEPSGGLLSGMTTMSGINDENIAAEASALGSAEGALADEAGAGPAGASSPGGDNRR